MMTDESTPEVRGRDSADWDERAAGEGGVAVRSDETKVGEGAKRNAEAKETPKLKLRRLKVNKWRKVRPGTELHFGDGIHALLGKNGAGKTTLLKLISMCVRGEFEELKEEEFHFEYDLSAAETRVHCDIQQERAGSVFEQAPRDLFKQRLRVSLLSEEGVEVASAFVNGTAAQFSIDGGDLQSFEFGLSHYRPFHALMVTQLRTDKGVVSTPPRLARPFAALGSASAAYRFDEMLGMLKCIEGFSGDDASAPTGLVINVVLSARMPLLLNHPLMPEGLAARMLRSREPADGEMRLNEEELPFLRRFLKESGFRSVDLVVPLLEKRHLEGGDKALTYKNARFSLQLANGDDVPHTIASYGQKRLLSFLYYAACNPSVLIVDELTNGLHHEWIEACVDELKKRQSFVATQHPLLIDYLPVNSANDAETAFIQCRLVDEDGKQWMQWRNTTPEEGEQFWKSYETGVQFISEILRTDGLW